MKPNKLNLGCGNDKKDGFVNVDIQADLNPDEVMDVRYLDGIDDNSIELINADHVIEHFPHWQTRTILKLWFNKLKPGGQLEMTCPDMGGIAQDIIDKKKTIDELMWDIYGKQDNPWNYHCAGFTAESITHILEDAGFFVVMCVPKTVHIYRNLVIIAVKRIKL